MNTFQIILDVVMILIIGITMLLGIIRGGAKSFFKSTKFIIVVLVTMLIGSLIVTLCQNLFVAKMFDGKISDKLVAQAEQVGGEFTFETVKAGIPNILQKVVPMDEIEQQFTSLSGNEVENARAIGKHIEGIVINIVSNITGYVIAFILAFIVCSIAILLIEKLVEIPSLKWLNRVAGILYGIVSAYFTTSIIAIIVAIIFGYEFIDGTIITKFIHNIGLFGF
jgi:hypothetical protein